jgi:hypothetical protein
VVLVWLYLVARPTTRRPEVTTPIQLILVGTWMLVCMIIVGATYVGSSLTCASPNGSCPPPGFLTSPYFWTAANVGLILLVILSTMVRVARRLGGGAIETGCSLRSRMCSTSSPEICSD